MIKALFVFYIFSIFIADPWVDGFAVRENHGKNGIEIQNSISKNITEFAKADSTFQHNHKDCSDDCNEHTCHLGHCGFLVNVTQFSVRSYLADLSVEYEMFIPSPHVFGIKRPPKLQA